MKFDILKKATFVAAGLVAGFAFTGNEAAAQDCTTKIGAVLPTSVDWGRPIAETAKYAVELANEAGGIAGCNIELVLRDSQVDPKVGVDAAKSLVDLDKVKVLLGAVSSGVSMPILTSVTVPSGVMQMSCCSSSTAFTGLAKEGKSKGLWFRTFATTGVQTAVGANLAKEMGYKNIAIFYKNDDWGQDMNRLLTEHFKAAGVDVTGSVAINDGQASYRAEVTKALQGKPQAIYLAIYPKEGISVVREWISLGGTQEMIMANSLKSDEFRDNVGLKYLGKAQGTDTSSPRVDSANTFVEMYKKKFNSEPNGPGLSNSFDATMIALLAMEAAGKDASGTDIAEQVKRITDPNGTPVTADVAGIKKAAEILKSGANVMYQGATGNVQFDANGDVSAPAVIWKFKDGGTEETSYISLEQVNAIFASMK